MNYLCAGYKAFFRRGDEPMRIMAILLSSGRPASDVTPILAERFLGKCLKAVGLLNLLRLHPEQVRDSERIFKRVG